MGSLNAASSDSLERIATHLLSSGNWRGRDSVVWWTPIIFHARGATTFLLFIVSPGISAAICGWVLGKPLLDPARVCGARSAAVRGAGIGTLALLLFAPLFSTIYVLSQPASEHWNVFGLAFLVLVGGFLAVWWLVALTGAAVGWGLNWLASVDVRRGS